MVTLLWQQWPLIDDCYKADGDEQTWILRQDETGRWALGLCPHASALVPDVMDIGVYETRQAAELIAQQIESGGDATLSVH